MTDFLMPSLGADMEAGTLVEWLKQPNETVQRGDIIAVVETDKGAIEIEVFQEGVVVELLVDPGCTVPVGTPLARIDGGEATANAKTSMPPPPQRPVQKPHASTTNLPPANKRILASPAARRLAQERDIDLATLKGSGPHGAIVSNDLDGPTSAAPQIRRSGLDPTAMRRAIAAAMSRSKREIPHYYLGTTIDMQRAQTWLAETNAERRPAARLLLGALLLKAVALALSKVPELNGFFIEGSARPSSAVHVGMAVAIRGGALVAPAIHNTAERSIEEVMLALRDLVTRARSGLLRSSELSDPTITLTSLGERGVEAIQPIIYPPQVAIVGFGSVMTRPWAVRDALAVRPVVRASLAADHRVSDGHRGALFLAEVDHLLQEPEAL
ncbi:MAG: dihydrolipoamide acetyltransferase family protein [Kiloniellales bacterium]